VNKNMVPFDDKSPMVTSGMRVGTAAMTSRGMKENEMLQIVEWIDDVLMHNDNESYIADVKQKVNTWMNGFPLYR